MFDKNRIYELNRVRALVKTTKLDARVTRYPIIDLDARVT